MKILKYFLIAIIVIILVLFLVFITSIIRFPYTKGKIQQDFEVKNIAKDTTFRYERYGNWVKAIDENANTGVGIPFTIAVSGNIDNEAKIFLQFVGHPGEVYSCLLPAGKVDTVFNGELYENKAEIVFLHQKATTGDLKLIFTLGTYTK